MSKIKLLQITHDLAIGGLQQVVVNLCRTIDKEMFDVSVLCLRDLGSFTPEVEKLGIKVTLLPQKEGRTDYLAFLAIAKFISKEKIDVIHTHNTQPFVDGTLAALISGVKTIIHTDHARDFPDKRRYMFAEWAMSHFAYKVVGVSEHTSNNLIKYEKISRSKVITIPNGIDGSIFSINLDREDKKRQLGITKNGPVIGLGVRLTEQKGITYLLQAMPEIIRAFPEITLIIAGDGDIKRKLLDEARELRLDNNIHFIGPRLDMVELLKLFDLYVLPSLWEGLPMVLLEAMAAGCPIIATNVGGNSTAIQHGVNGSLIEPANPAQISSEVIKLLKDGNLRNKYIKNASDTFNEKFSAEIMVRKYQELYIGGFTKNK